MKKEEDRHIRLKLNIMISLINQIIVIIHGLILPRYYIQIFGSNTYGLLASITQFLAMISLMELGIGAVIQSSLYEPLAKKNFCEISKIIKSAESFFRKIAFIFIIYTSILCIIYPSYVDSDLSSISVSFLIILVSLNTLSEYFFGITNRLLIVADQRGYINSLIQCISYIVNLLVCVNLMNKGADIYLVKACSVLVFLIKPLILKQYAKKQYKINMKVSYDKEPIKQKWNGIAQHLAYYVTRQTDIIVLTIFSSLENVAIYSVYNIVTNGMSTLIYSVNSGTQALLGNMIANKELQNLKEFFLKFEWIMHNITICVYSCVGLLIVPFVSVYTIGVEDVLYYQPVFAGVFTLSSAMYVMRLPYNMMINAAGKYKQTQLSSIIEMSLNILVTLVLVNNMGIVGVAIGTLVALLYRTVYSAYYIGQLYQAVYHFKIFIARIIKDICIVLIIILSTSRMSFIVTSYVEWIMLAIKTSGIVIGQLIIFNLIFEYKNTKNLVKNIFRNKSCVITRRGK